MTIDVLSSIISKLFDAGFTVVGIVSDLCTSNVKVWSQLNIGHDQNCCFPHPSNSLLNVYVFGDVPHLIKLLRNHILDQGFWVKNTLINRDCFENLLQLSSSELTIAYKINRYHLDLKGSESQKSNSVAKSIRFCGENRLLPSVLP